MGRTDEFTWDDEKSEILARSRGFHLLKVAESIFYSYHFLYTNNRYPDQLRAIGFHEGKLLTLAFSENESSTHLITYWVSSNAEQKLYDQGGIS